VWWHAYVCYYCLKIAFVENTVEMVQQRLFSKIASKTVQQQFFQMSAFILGSILTKTKRFTHRDNNNRIVLRFKYT
jgi:hypothetical protein